MASLDTLQGTLGHRRATHLLRRASFRFTKWKVDQMATQTAEEAVDTLVIAFPPDLAQPVYDDPQTTTVESVMWINPVGQTPPDQDFNLQRRIIGWWLHEALNDAGVGHKMVFFWHQYLAVTANTLNNFTFYDYLALLRWGALGNFKKLATKIVADNTMLRYLNNDQNTEQNPNENFAREFLELFTIGKGPQIAPGDYTHYTEDDIVQAARVLTGFRTRTQRDQLDPETGIPRGIVQFNRHDTGSKTFSEKFQNTTIQGAANAAGVYTEVSNFVNMVFAQAEVAKNICRRLYRFFVHPNITPAIETDIIAPLADTFRNNNYEIASVLKKLLQSEHFYDADDSDNKDEIVGGMIKSPLDLALPALSFFNIAIPDPITNNYDHYIRFFQQGVIERMLGYANLPLFYPVDVAGYAAYHQAPEYNRNWFNSSSIIARYKLPQMLLTGKRVLGGGPNTSIGIKLNIVPWVRDSGVCSDPSDPYVLVRDLLDYMLPETVDDDRFNYFYNQIFLDNLPASDWTYEWQNYLNTGNEQEVKIALERLVTYIMFSPEYQTF
ncbi:MAG: DUF1800 family protein [Haliscomenobacteraceae bacterium CHB4]|nr:hypothetical protein [Saprospiraceae bacterium]MCE7922289.1 DUF1800 family protein [Haliscomenobacteraceae bacterium CHB4]